MFSPSQAQNKENNQALSSKLLEACAAGSIKDAHALLAEEGCGVNDVDKESGKTALHFGLESGNADLCLWLLSKGADPYIR